MTISNYGPIGSFARVGSSVAACALAVMVASAPPTFAETSLVSGIRVAQAMKSNQAGATAAEEAIKFGDLVLSGIWTRATPRGAKVAIGALKITNNGKEADRLIGGTASVAGRFEIHEMSMEGNIMKMRPVAGGLQIKPGATVELKPGGYHVMFMDLKEPFFEGQSIKSTLHFEKAGKIDVSFAVRGIGAGAAHDKH
jgi:hypothetical protein